MHIYDKFVFLCERKGVDEVTAYKEIPLNKGTVSLWRTAKKNGEEKIPSLKIALKMAKYFDAPVAYLTGDTDDPSDKSLTHWAELLPEENKKPTTVSGSGQIPNYSKLSDTNKSIVDSMIAQLLAAQSNDQ